jgi:isopenicillin N synthase-like dioxygenase
MQQIREFFKENISLAILRAIFNALNLSEYLPELIVTPDYSFSIIYYPFGNFAEKRFGEHKDIPLINVLWAPQAGLEAKINDEWQAVEPQEGYVTVQLGQLLEAVTNGLCHATEHRVRLDNNTAERLSIASFLGPKSDISVKNLVTSKMITDRYHDFVKQRLNRFFGEKDDG